MKQPTKTKTMWAWILVNKKDGRMYCSFGTGKIATYDTKKEALAAVKIENNLQKIFNNNTDVTYARCLITYTLPKGKKNGR